MDFDTHPTDTEPSTTVSASLYGPYVGHFDKISFTADEFVHIVDELQADPHAAKEMTHLLSNISTYANA